MVESRWCFRENVAPCRKRYFIRKRVRLIEMKTCIWAGRIDQIIKYRIACGHYLQLKSSLVYVLHAGRAIMTA